jgi:integrase
MLLKRGKTYHTRIMLDGKLYQKSLRTHNRSEAIKLESVFRSGLIRHEFGILDAAKAPTLEQFEPQLLAHLKANTAPRTYLFYKQNVAALKKFLPLAETRLHKIDQPMIESFIQFRLKPDGKKKRKLTPVTVNHSLRTLRRILHLAQDWKLIREVPKIKMLPGEHERDYVLSDSEVQQMTQYLQSAYPTATMHHMLPFLVDTGLRINEACGLRKEDIEYRDELPCLIKITKGKSKYAKREIPLTNRAALALVECLEQSRCEFVFTPKGGRRPMTRHYPSEMFRVIRDALNIGPECVLHSTRHTFCTRLGNGGADAFAIQKLAGHSSITISQRYVHSDLAAKRVAIALLNALNQPKPQQAPDGTIKEI